MFGINKYTFMRKNAKKANARRLYILGWPIDGIAKRVKVKKSTVIEWTKGF